MGESELGDGHVFASETSFVNKKLSLHDDWVAGSLLARFVEVPGDQIDVADIIKSTISENLDFKLFFCSLLYLLITSAQKKVINWGGQPTKKDHKNSEDSNLFQDIYYTYEVLENEKRFGHCIEQEFKVARYLHTVLVPSVEGLAFLCVCCG